MFEIPSLLKQSVRLYGTHALAFLFISVVELPVLVALVSVFGPTSVIVQIESLSAEQLIFAALTHAAVVAYSGGNPRFRSCYRVVISKFRALLELLVRQFGAVLLLAITIVGIPFAIRTLIRWSFGLQALVARDTSAKEAIDFSFGLVKGLWWQVAATAMFIYLLYAAPGIALLILRAVILGWSYSIEWLIVTSVLSAALRPLVVSFWTLLFLQLEGRHETRLASVSATS